MPIDERMSTFNVRKLLQGQHTRHERELLENILEPNDVVMELGGGIGMVAIACAKVTGSDRVYSYEANPELEPLTRDNYALNGVDPTLKICMLGCRIGGRTFYLEEHSSRSSAVVNAGRRAIEVPVERFNDEVRRIRPSILVVDIQGGEDELVDFTDLSTVEKLLIEVHPDITGVRRANSIRRGLRRMGFDESARAEKNILVHAPAVRHQIIWNRFRFELTECLAHLVCHVRRRPCGVASGVVRMSFV